MNGFLEYVPGNSFLHKMNPVAKLLASFVIVIACFTTSSFVVLGIILVLDVALATSCGMLKQALGLARAVAIFSLLLAVLALLFTPEGDVLVAMMDLILGYPSDEISFIGLFMTNVQYQNKGVGSQVIREVCDELKQLGYQKVRLGVDKGNPQSHAFWKKNGFSQIAETQYHVMELAL